MAGTLLQSTKELEKSFTAWAKEIVRIFDNPAIFAGGGGSGYTDPEPFQILHKYSYLYLNSKI